MEKTGDEKQHWYEEEATQQGVEREGEGCRQTDATRTQTCPGLQAACLSRSFLPSIQQTFIKYTLCARLPLGT